MEQIKEIEKNFKSIEDETEKKLYCLKEFNYKLDEELKKKFALTCDIRIDNNQNSLTKNVFLGEKKFFVEENARIINFIIQKKSFTRFIYSCTYLQKVIKYYDIQYYSTNQDKLDDSLEFEISDDSIYELFHQNNITDIFKIEFDDSKIKELFKARFFVNRDKISGLSLNSEFYYPQNANDLLDLTIFSKYIVKIKKFPWNINENILYFIGPKGASKSLFLMNFCVDCNSSEFPTLYINYKVFKILNDINRKYYFKKEMAYLFFEYNAFKAFYTEKYHKLINKGNDSFIHNLKEFIQKLMNIYENYFKKKIILIIDNFDENNEELFNEMDKIINLVKENPKKIKLIISGCSEFLKNKFELFLKNGSFTDIIDRQRLFIYDLKLENKNEIKTLAAYNFRKNIKDEELEETLVNEEKNYCEKFNLYGMHFSIINNKKHLNLEKLLKYIHIIPFEYLNFYINKPDNSFTFEFANPIYLSAVKKSIKAQIKEKSLQFLLKNDNRDYIINGIYEEKLLIQLISNNKFNLKNFGISENNLIEVNKIYELKDKKYGKTSQKIDIGLPIIITQSNFLGELYDLLVLIPQKDNDKTVYMAYIIQIDTNKPEEKILEIKDDFNLNKTKYIAGIKKLIDNNIMLENIELLFIFDKETQEQLIQRNENINKCGVKYCTKNNIKFYCFSSETFKLYKSLDIYTFTEIEEFGDFSKKRNWNIYENERFNFLNEEEIHFINSKLGDDIIGCWIFYTGPRKNSIEINDEKIYVIENGLDRYYIIEGIIYNYKFEKINEDKIIKNIKTKNEAFKIFILDKFPNSGIIKRKSK